MNNSTIGMGNAYYRIVQVDPGWHVLRPNASTPHGFDSLDDAVAFVRRDNDAVTVIEILAGGVYMVKRIVPDT